MWPQYGVRGSGPMRAVHWSSTQQHSAIGNSAREGGRREQDREGGREREGGRREQDREGGREREGRREHINEGDIKCYGL